MTDIPGSAQIGAHTYEIRTDPETLLQLREAGVCGDSRPDRLVIRIDTDLPHTSQAETVLHELLHCCWAQTGLKTEERISEAEELAIASLAPVVFNMLRSNPEIVDYLMS